MQLQAAAAAQLAKPSAAVGMKPGQSSAGAGKASFVICEICDGYIKDLDQLRNHMQWMHKVKVSCRLSNKLRNIINFRTSSILDSSENDIQSPATQLPEMSI